mmetsp:Transcript_4424/g.11237  ORF Transcript_4424/g.11237 Transcript_4424/m.11237 type:complete len:266 (-) Transcript_4424:807-1604(-)
MFADRFLASEATMVRSRIVEPPALSKHGRHRSKTHRRQCTRVTAVGGREIKPQHRITHAESPGKSPHRSHQKPFSYPSALCSPTAYSSRSSTPSHVGQSMPCTTPPLGGPPCAAAPTPSFLWASSGVSSSPNVASSATGCCCHPGGGYCGARRKIDPCKLSHPSLLPSSLCDGVTSRPAVAAAGSTRAVSPASPTCTPCSASIRFSLSVASILAISRLASVTPSSAAIWKSSAAAAGSGAEPQPFLRQLAVLKMARGCPESAAEA